MLDERKENHMRRSKEGIKPVLGLNAGSLVNEESGDGFMALY